MATIVSSPGVPSALRNPLRRLVLAPRCAGSALGARRRLLRGEGPRHLAHLGQA